MTEISLYTDRIIHTAIRHLGERETPNNSGFRDKDFEARMKEVGWNKGLAWCSYFAELVWKEAYADNREMVMRFDKLFSGSATATYKNFDLCKLFVCSSTPALGALAVYRFGNGWKGHVGIVETIMLGDVINIEGNGSIEGSREGIEVVRKRRPIITRYSPLNLNIVGYVHPL